MTRPRRGNTVPWKPTRPELAAAYGRTVADLLAPNLRVLFCGINPGLYSGAVGHHFARPGNRFWPTLHAAGFTDRLLSAFEERELLRAGYGITNLVERATATANELTAKELIVGGRHLLRKIRRYRPAVVAVLGITAYRTAFQCKRVTVGLQAERLGDAAVWVLPSPSGLNAHFQLRDLARLFQDLRHAVATGGDRPMAEATA